MLRYLTFNRNSCAICNRPGAFQLDGTAPYRRLGITSGSSSQTGVPNAQNNPHAGSVGRCKYACAHWIAGYRTGPRIPSSCDPLLPRRSWLPVFPLVLARAPRPSSMIIAMQLRRGRHLLCSPRRVLSVRFPLIPSKPNASAVSITLFCAKLLFVACRKPNAAAQPNWRGLRRH